MRLARPYTVAVGRAAGPHALPLARIKKIMKRSTAGDGGAGGESRMISGEAPVVFSRACELFVAELTRAAWAATLEGKRRTVHREDVAAAVRDVDLFDFLAALVVAHGDAAGCQGALD
ncbi:LOW QUALITY PROTEIN: hypothetical protein BRADI_5g26800v3 [Brachypodium distachyon]|uniref:Transcription factor CBF/NF-Y/archaeal histone domain-containing protein n=1 Tax=Brachypodium distachyon TaxID=15368 RepID=A0A2K2CJH5_BRADI|nr:LOW QUALITY PROTEIN: hypothetical protein BRADI_5g26800v3 [Brachypodium distachyon]